MSNEINVPINVESNDNECKKKPPKRFYTLFVILIIMTLSTVFKLYCYALPLPQNAFSQRAFEVNNHPLISVTFHIEQKYAWMYPGLKDKVLRFNVDHNDNVDALKRIIERAVPKITSTTVNLMYDGKPLIEDILYNGKTLTNADIKSLRDGDSISIVMSK